MRKRLFIAALAITSVVFVVGVIVYQDPSLLGSPLSGTSQSQVCGKCAVRRTVVEHEWGGWRDRETIEELESTVLSEQLDHFGAPGCDHDWFMTSHGVWFEGGGHAHGTGDADPITVRVLVDTAAGASALVAFAEATGRRPRAVWSTLARWCRTRIERDPFFDGLPSDAPANRGRIIEWLKQNYAEVERSAKAWTPLHRSKGGGRKGGGAGWSQRAN
jgi:hypothetical protein